MKSLVFARFRGVFCCLLSAALLWFCLWLGACAGKESPGPAAQTAGRAAAAADGADSVTARHLQFLSACGWEAEGPVAVETLRVPAEWNETWAAYNRLQLAQGFDLRSYAGRTLEKYVYNIKNDPAAAKGERVLANVLEADGQIVGGDLCAPALAGFLHGFHGETDGYDQAG